MQQTMPLTKSNFFVICAPGLEDVTAREIQHFFPQLQVTVEHGGVLVDAPLAIGFELNRWLKTATRVLVRLGSFSCRDFPKFFKKVSDFPWENWISNQADVRGHASSRASRVKIKTRIEETCREARIYRLRKQGRPHARFNEPADIFIRFENDICTLSLDTSGEVLHKRGTRPFSSEAPLRETLAAALVRLMLESASPETPTQEITWIDPMTGGGTLLIEAMGLNHPIFSRRFAFETPNLGPAAMAAANQVREQGGGEIMVKKNMERDLFSNYLGIDINEKTLDAAKQNLDKMISCLKENQATLPVVNLIQADFFKMDFLPKSTISGAWQVDKKVELSNSLVGARNWLVANPPYGERLNLDSEKMSSSAKFSESRESEAKELKSYYENLFETSERLAHPEISCFLIPQKAQPKKLRTPRTWRLANSRDFENGGLPVCALIFKRA